MHWILMDREEILLPLINGAFARFRVRIVCATTPQVSCSRNLSNGNVGFNEDATSCCGLVTSTSTYVYFNNELKCQAVLPTCDVTSIARLFVKTMGMAGWRWVYG